MKMPEYVKPTSCSLAQIASTYPNRQRFLTELTLDPPSATSDEAGAPLLDEDYLILSTIHSAKGQEWKSVFVLNCVDGCMPSDLAVGSTPEIEEERRLLYVAMTRAKDHLHIDRAAAFLCPSATRQWRPAHVCSPNQVHSRHDHRAFRAMRLASRHARTRFDTQSGHQSRRHRGSGQKQVALIVMRL